MIYFLETGSVQLVVHSKHCPPVVHDLHVVPYPATTEPVRDTPWARLVVGRFVYLYCSLG